MQHIIKQIKAISKKYNTKSGEKESVSKRVDLGVTDIFETGECVAVISKTDFDGIDKTIADKDATISNLNDSVANFKAEIETKTNKIGELSKEIKALKNDAAKLKSDISAKDDIIDKLTTDVAAKDEKLTDSEKTISDLNAKLDEVNAAISELKELLLTKDSTIADLDKQIAVYDAIDIDKLTAKADELDKSKNAVILQQKQITEYIQLVNYHKEKATAYKNQRWYHKALGKDAAAEITTPTLHLIDDSGNPISKDDDVAPDSNDDDSGDKVTLI